MAGTPDPTAGTCPACRELVHDADCELAGDGRPTEDDRPVAAALARMRQLLTRPEGSPDPLAAAWLAAARERVGPDGRYREAVLLLTQAVLIAHQRTSSERCSCGWAELGASHAAHVAERLAAEGVLRDAP